MKNRYIILLLVILTACKNKAFDIDSLSRFHKVYIVQASQNPYSSILEITDSVQNILISCGLGGSIPAKHDISLRVSAFYDSVITYNKKNSTDYIAVPKESFELSSEDITIQKGKHISSSINISFKTKGYIEPSKSYLLPIGISPVGNNISVNDKLQVLYLVITGAYPIGKEPPIKVFNLEGKALISAFPYQNALINVESNGLFHTYLWDDESKAYNITDAFPNGGWNIFNKVLGTSDHLITRWAGTGTLWEYSFNVSKLSMTSDYTSHGEGFNDFDIMSYSNKFDGLLCRKPSGELYLIKRGTTMWDKLTLIGKDFNSYKMITTYQNGFLCIDDKGEMFYYQIKNDLSLGKKEHVGSGWNKYKSIISKGDQLLALDSNNILWQYNFNLAGFWDVQ